MKVVLTWRKQVTWLEPQAGASPGSGLPVRWLVAEHCQINGREHNFGSVGASAVRIAHRPQNRASVACSHCRGPSARRVVRVAPSCYPAPSSTASRRGCALCTHSGDTAVCNIYYTVHELELELKRTCCLRLAVTPGTARLILGSRRFRGGAVARCASAEPGRAGCSAPCGACGPAK